MPDDEPTPASELPGASDRDRSERDRSERDRSEPVTEQLPVVPTDSLALGATEQLPVVPTEQAFPGVTRAVPVVAVAEPADGWSPDGTPAGGTDPPVRPRDPARRLVLVTLLLAVVAGTLGIMSVFNAPRLSALDEATHIDWAWNAAHFHLARDGQPLSAYTLNSWSCRGQANIKQLPPCGSGAPASSYPGAGQQYNGFHPPVYYAITGLTARAMSAVFGLDFIDAARLLGSLWLFAAMLGLYLTMRYWRLDWRFAFGAALFLPLIPTVLHASSTVTNDAPSVLFGVAAVFVLGRVLIYRNAGWVLPTLLTALAASTKVLNGVGLLVAAGVFLLISLIQWRGRGFRAVMPLLRTALLMIAAAGAVYLVWDRISSARTYPNWINPIGGVNTAPIVGGPLDEWLPTFVNGFRLASNYYLDPEVNSAYSRAWVTVISTLFAASSLIGLAVFRRGTPRWILSGALFLGCIAYPVVVQIQTYIGSDTYFPAVSTRYGLSLIPMAVAVLAVIAADRRLLRTTGVFLGLGFVTVLLSTAGVLN